MSLIKYNIKIFQFEKVKKVGAEKTLGIFESFFTINIFNYNFKNGVKFSEIEYKYLLVLLFWE